MEGLIFDVQRFSVHDGPGIRTTVFMKGCPLRCQWCHNPEGLLPKIQLQYMEKECLHCGRCGSRTALSDAEVCPSGALKICGRKVSPEALLAEILRDRSFYGTEGGVTFSGGECMMQADFVAEMLKAVKAAGISTVIDTSGCAPWSDFEKTLAFCDLYLYDVKLFDPALHRKYTGVDNRLILDNLRRLSEAGKSFWVRIPVIPDVNDSAGEMTAIAEFLAPLRGLQELRLMPYHTLGKSKYETLGMVCPYQTEKQVFPETLAQFRRIFRRYGIPCAE